MCQTALTEGVSAGDLSYQRAHIESFEANEANRSNRDKFCSPHLRDALAGLGPRRLARTAIAGSAAGVSNEKQPRIGFGTPIRRPRFTSGLDSTHFSLDTASPIA
jgi:hypothetical protein